MTTPLLSVRGLAVTFATPFGPLRGLDGANFDVAAGEVLALVGESGSGKSVASLAIMGVLGAGGDGARATVEGSAIWDDTTDLLRLGHGARRPGLAMVFQEPMTALNPVLRVGRQIAEAVILHDRVDGAAAAARVTALLLEMGFPDPIGAARAYPHELSGGMRQRALIALAMACRPRLLIADEPTTALDATVQARVLGLLTGLRRSHGLAMLLVTHDFGVVAGVADQVAVMYGGRVVESGPVAALLARPAHPYTRALLAAVPRLDLTRGVALPAEELPGTPPDPRRPPPGCRFHPRCAMARPGLCDAGSPPPPRALGEGRAVACHLVAA
jgi:oligopeptide/dipeptide ABC transporter ATP-binding protein